MKARKLLMTALVAASAMGCAFAQIPDLLNALDAGGRAMGMGGSIYTSGVDTMSSVNNPAGLGFIDTPQFGITFRNLPESRSIATGISYATRRVTTGGTSGDRSVSHLGFALPISGRGGRHIGTVGVAYTVAGFLRDREYGVFGADSSFESRKSKTDLITVSFGKPASANVTWGAGVVLAHQSVSDETILNIGGGTSTSETDSTGLGLGLIAGVQIVPTNAPNISLGASVRTPISLDMKGSGDTFVDRVPGRISGSIAVRKDGLRNGRDFVVYGAQLDHYFEDGNGAFAQKDKLGYGVGVEYNYDKGGARIPLRVGFSSTGDGGAMYQSRNTLTFGFGYRPYGSASSIDFNFADANEGGFDMGISYTYRFSK